MMSFYFGLNSSLPWTLGWICSIKNFFAALKVPSKVNPFNQRKDAVFFFIFPKMLIVKIKQGITLSALWMMGPNPFLPKMTGLLSRKFDPVFKPSWRLCLRWSKGNATSSPFSNGVGTAHDNPRFITSLKTSHCALYLLWNSYNLLVARSH